MVVNSGCHAGTYCARLGNTTPPNGDSTISQTFTVPNGTTVCGTRRPARTRSRTTAALVTLTDDTAGTTTTLLSKACTTNSWTNLSASVTAGHTYMLTLTSHDDNYSADPTYTLFDDVTLN